MAATANRLCCLVPMNFVAEGEEARHCRIDLVVQRRIVSCPANIDAISRPGELKIVDRSIAYGGGKFRDGHFARLIPRIGKRGEVAVAPQSASFIRMQEVNPSVLRKLEHEASLLCDIPIAANSLFTPVGRYTDLG